MFVRINVIYCKIRCVLAKTLFPEPEFKLDRNGAVRLVERTTTDQSLDCFESCVEDDEPTDGKEIQFNYPSNTPPFCTPRDSTDEDNDENTNGPSPANLARGVSELCGSLTTIDDGPVVTEARLTESDPGPVIIPHLQPTRSDKSSSEEATKPPSPQERPPESQERKAKKAGYGYQAPDFFPMVLDVDIEDNDLTYKIVRMMLKSTENLYSPHRMHFVRLHRDVVFVGVELISGAFLATHIHRSLLLVGMALK